MNKQNFNNSKIEYEKAIKLRDKWKVKNNIIVVPLVVLSYEVKRLLELSTLTNHKGGLNRITFG